MRKLDLEIKVDWAWYDAYQDEDKNYYVKKDGKYIPVCRKDDYSGEFRFSEKPYPAEKVMKKRIDKLMKKHFPNPPDRPFEFGPGISELQFSASLGAEGRNQAFIDELRSFGYEVGTDADYALPKSFYTIIVRCKTEDVPEVRNTAIKYQIHSKNPGVKTLGWKIKED